MVKINHKDIKFISKPDEKFLIDCVKSNPKVLTIINNPSKEVCIEAVKKDPRMIHYVPNKDYDIFIKFINGVKFLKNVDFSNLDINNVNTVDELYEYAHEYYKKLKLIK